MKIDKKQISALFHSYDDPHSPGFSVGVIHSNEFLFCKGFGQATLEHFSPITPDTVFDVGSMAKQFVGFSIALLEDDTQLRICDKIHKYLPELPAYGKEITIANLLYHTSGIRNYTVMAYYMMGYHESDAITKEEVYELLLRVKSPNFSPGERWEYSDSNYFLLTKIIERISGKTLKEFSDENIFHPLAMKNTLFRDCHSQIIRNRAMSYVSHPIAFESPFRYRDQDDPTALFSTLVSNYEHVGAEGLFSTLNDLFKWDQNLSNNCLGKRKQELVGKVLSPEVQISEDLGYGYGINIGHLKGKEFYGHDGAIHGYTSSMTHFPEEDVSIICLSNQNQVAAWEIRNQTMDIIFPDKAMATSSPQPLEHRKVDLDARGIAGSYQNAKTASIWKVVAKDDRVFIQENKDWGFEISENEPFHFMAVKPELAMKLSFQVDADGEILGIKGVADGEMFTYIPFIRNELSVNDLAEYIGGYRSDELNTTFIVEIEQQMLSVRNENKHFCSMDLLYAPTIEDSFIAYDPHPISSQISFLRVDGQIESFVYRDYDGDGREEFKFIKMGSAPTRVGAEPSAPGG